MSRKFTGLSLIILFFSISTSFAQEPETGKILKGQIAAPDLEGASIHIINLTQRTGTVNSPSGEFQIIVEKGDVLQFSSVQYKKLEISITSEIFEKGFLYVELSEELNELEEVTVSNIDLTGNLGVDLENIAVVRDLPTTISFKNIKHMRFESDINDPQAAPENIAFKENMVMQPGGLNLLGIGDAISGLLGIQKDAGPPPVVNKQPLTTIATRMRKIFDDDFFRSSLGIKEENINDFIFYIDEQGLTSQMLEEKNRLTLIDFLFDKSKNYKKIRAGN